MAALEGSRILLIDDNPRLLRSMAFLMTVAGFEVTTAGSAAEGLERLENATPDLIFADAEMPTTDGYAFMSTVHADRRWSKVPIVLTSARYDLHDMLRALDLGAEDFIPKPFDIYDLLDAIHRALAATHMARKAS